MNETPFIKHHPEQQEDEIYMGNSLLAGFLKSAWRLKRRGIQALDCNGKPINDPDDDFRPWFVKRSEVQEKADSSTLEFTKQALNEMLQEGRI